MGQSTKEAVVGAGKEDGLTYTEHCHHRVSEKRGFWYGILSLVPGIRMWMAPLCLWGLHTSGGAKAKSVPRH